MCALLLLMFRRRAATGREIELMKALTIYVTAMLLIGLAILLVAALLR